ncbi:hypothetical protein Leryth_002007 [Lithospermum erythrorhizon]|nr:hypothetical protein Leryth_002007 [Lithospermum erythrorhizon]
MQWYPIMILTTDCYTDLVRNRGEVLDLRIFEYCESIPDIAWVGIPTAPAWLPTDMLIKCAHAYASCRNPQDV